MAVVGMCHLCPRPALTSCHQCGRPTCVLHLDASHRLCASCQSGKRAVTIRSR